jgi:hypothetical protein
VGISLTQDGLLDTIEFNMETISDLQTTEWQHLVLCWEAGDEELTFYVDGDDAVLDPASLVVKSAPSLGSPDTVLPPDPYLAAMTELYVGKGGKDKVACWKGYIDEVVILNFKVTSEEVGDLYFGELPVLEEASSIKETETYATIKVLPNPMKTSARIEFGTPTEARVSVEIFNVCGSSVEILTDNIYQPGIHSINWSPTNISPGVYVGRMKANNSVETFKIVVQ